MAQLVSKICLGCNTVFQGSDSAKTCSARCRKRLQRAKARTEQELYAVKEAAEDLAHKVEVRVEQASASEGGYVDLGAKEAEQTKEIEDSPRFENNLHPWQQNEPRVHEDSLESAGDNNIRSASTLDLPIVQNLSAAGTPAETIDETRNNETVTESQQKTPSQTTIVHHHHYSGGEWPKTLAIVAAVIIMAGSLFFLVMRSNHQASLNQQNQSQAIQQLAQTLGNSPIKGQPDATKIDFNVDTEISRGAKLTATGQVAIQNEADSTHAFTVQTASGSDVITADTKDGRVGIGTAPTGTATLQVGGDITANGNIVAGSIASSGNSFALTKQGLSLNGTLVCTTNGCVSSTPVPSINPAIANLDVANVAFLGDSQTFNGSNTFSGASTFENTVDVKSVFRVQNSAGTDLLAVNASSGKVGVGTSPSASGAALQVGGDVNVSGAYRVGNNQGASLTCPAGDIIDSPIVIGGIIIGGTCQVNLAGSVPTFQQVYNASSNPHITLNSASGTLTVQDAVTPLGFNLFVVQSNGGATKYFAVNTNGAQVVGDVDITGQYKVNGSPLSSSVLADTSNLAKLNAAQTFSGANTFSNVSNSFTGNGSGLSNVNASQLNGQAGSYYTNASNLVSGNLNDARLSNNVALHNSNQTFTGINTFSNSGNAFTGSGSGLTSLNGSNISSGTVADARLSSNVALKNGNNTFTGANTFALSTGPLQVQDATTPLGTDLFEVTDSTGATKYFAVSATGATINGNDVCTTAGNCAGVGGDVTSSGGTVNHLAKFTASNAIADSLILDDGTSVTIGGDLAANNITQNGYQVCDTSGNCVGGGGAGSSIGGSGTSNKLAMFTAAGTIGDSVLSQSGTTVTANGNLNTTSQYQLNGSQVSSSILSNDGNLAKLDGSQTFTGINVFNNASNSFTGNGSGLTSLNGSNISTGTVADARLSSNVALLNANQSFTGANTFSNSGNSFTGDGSNLTNLNGSNISSGTVADARLSNNVALLNANQTASGNKVFTGTVLVQNTGSTAFQIQKSDGTGNLFVADTTDGKVGIGLAPSSSGSTLQVSGSVSSSTGFVVNGSTGSSVTCTGGNVLQNPVLVGGIITGGTCIANGGGTTPSLQQVYTSSNPAVITLNSSNGGLAIKDNSTPLGSSLFTVEDNGASTKYLDVSATGVTASNLTVNNAAIITGAATLNGAATIAGAATLNGSVLAKNTSNSTTAFQIQSSSSANLFTVDTSDSNISLGQLTNGALGTWQTNVNALPTARSDASYVTLNGYVYIIGGDAGSTAQSTVYYAKLNADGSTGAWSTTTSLPQALNVLSSVTANGYIYALGGQNSSNTQQSTVYYAKQGSNGTLSSWSTNVNALPQPLESPSSITYNGYVYVMGGWNSTNQSTVYYAKLNADGSTGAWQTNTNALPAVRQRTTAITSSGYVYVLGGYDGSSSQSTVYYAKLNADGSTGAWSTNVNALPQPITEAASVAVNGYIYEIAGCGTTCPSANIYYAKLNADGSTGAWSTNVNALPLGLRASPASVAANGYVYVVGGTTSSPQSTVYYASVNGVTRNAGQVSIADQLTVGNGLTVAGNTTFQPTADSTTAFSIQNSNGGSLFNIDSTNSNIAIAGLDSGQLGAWQTSSNALPTTLAESTSVTANGYVYVLGGKAASAQSTVYYAKLNADGSTGTWTTSSKPLPVTITDATSVTANGYIYVIGGSQGAGTGNNVYYAKLNADGSTGAWTTSANPLPQTVVQAASIVANGYIYEIGGSGSGTGCSSNVCNNVYYAKLNSDGSTGAWQTNANALTQALFSESAATANGYVYVLSGYTGSGYSATVYYAKLNADGSTGTWTTSGSIIPQSVTGAPAVVSNGYMYLIGGNHSGTYQSSIYYAKLNGDGTVGSWATNTNSLPQPIYWGQSVSYNGYIYLISGYTTGTTKVATVYYASTSRVQIGANVDLIGTQSGDGTAGGSLTANNITAAANIQVNGYGSFAQGLSVAGTTSLQGGLAVDGGATYNTYSASLGSGFGVGATYGYTTPLSTAAADFNGDGKADVVATNPSSNIISVFMGNGDGTLGARADYATGSSPERVAAADFNGDGKPDIAVTNYSSNTVSVFLNNGNGTFATKVDYASDSGGQPYGITTADFNSDGKPDIAVVNGNTNTVSVFLNNGNGTFAPKTSYSVTNAYGMIAAADFNGDGKPDIAVTYGGGVEVMINNGYGFNPAVGYTFGSSNGTLALATGDFNGDGRPDIAETGGNNSYVYIFRNNGDGTFAAYTRYSLSINQVSTIIAADLNSDGKTDLALAEGNFANTVTILPGNGNGTFGSRTDYSIGASGSRFSGMATADFTGDGKLDLVVSDNYQQNIYVLDNGATTVTTSNSGALSIATPNGSTTGLIVQGSSGQTADLLRLQDSSSNELLAISSSGTLETNSIDSLTGSLNIGSSASAGISLQQNTSIAAYRSFTSNGSATFVDAANSTTAFQVQNSSGMNLLSADTTNLGINVSGANLLLNGVTPSGLVTAAGTNSSGSFAGASGSTYYYKVTAIVNGQETTPSSEASFNSGNFSPIAPPYTAATLALTTGSNLGIGTYQYEVTYVTANGETNGGTSASITTTSGNQAVNLTTIPTGPTGTTSRKIYRTAVGGSTYKLLATIADNTTTTYSDATADASLGATIPGSNTARTNTNSINLSWAGVPGATSYKIYRGTATGAESAYQTSSTNSFTDSGSAGTAGTMPTLSPFGKIGIGTSAPTASLDVRGTALFKNGTDSANAFQIQNAAGTNIMNIDTTNKLVAINGGATYQTVSYNPTTGFGAYVSYPGQNNSSNQTVGSAIGDFNNDGKPDVAISYQGATNNVSILLNNGDGTLGAKTDYNTGLYAPYRIVSADFNGDGYADIATLEYSNQCVQVLLNKGNGTFATPSTYCFVANSGSNLVTGDFNGDGKPDIAVADSSQLAVFINNGNGTFASVVTYTASSASFITTGDFNGDGKLDIATAGGSSTAYTSIFLNNGNGTFAARSDYSIESNPLSITAADFNGDGKTDLAFGVSGGGNYHIEAMLNNGDGTFSGGSDYSTPGTNQLSNLVAADFNGDGKPDLASINVYTTSVAVFLNNGNGTFAAYNSYTAPYANSGLLPLLSADFNGDGKPDLGMSTWSTGSPYASNYSILMNGATTVATAHSGALSLGVPNSSTTGLIIQGASGQTDDLLHIQNSSGALLASVTSNGVLEANSIDSTTPATLNIGASNASNVNIGFAGSTATITSSLRSLGSAIFKDASNSTTALQIQSAAGQSLLTADTTNMSIDVNQGNLVLGTVTPTIIGTSAGTNSSGSFAGASGTTYYYEVTAIINGSETTPSAENSFTSSSFTPISAPSSAPTLVVAAGTNLGIGTYQYEVTYVTANGETTGGTSASVTTTSGNQAVNLTAIPTGPSGTTSRKIYRTAVGGSTYKLLATIGDNTTTTYSDTTTDASLGATVPSSNTARTNTNSITVAWTSVAGATSYKVYRGTASGGESAYQTTTATSLTDSGSAGTAGTVPTLSPFGRIGIGIAAPTASLDVRGTALFKNGSDSANAFQIQSAAGSSVVNVDTTNKLLAIDGGASYQTVSYSSGSGFGGASYAAGADPESVASADFNGDGKLDLVTANTSGNTMSVFLNNGDGTFAAKVDYTTGTGPLYIRSADLNGDGKPDVVTSDYNASTVSVLINNGDGTFAAKVDYTTGSGPHGISLADFNGDGKPDIVVANYLANTVSVLLNNGNGTFASKVDYATGASPRDIATGDFNSDGKQDIAVVNFGANTVSILLGNGDGTFAAKVDYATNSSPVGEAVSDFNGDGVPDLAIGYSSGVSVLIGNGDGTFAAKVNYAGGYGSSALSTADFNGDGKTDIVQSVSSNGRIIIYQNSGTGTFDTGTSYIYAPSIGNTTGDFNSDGKPDVALADGSGYNNYLTILMNGMSTVYTTHNGAIGITTPGAGTAGLIIKSSSGQTEDLFRVQDSTSSALVKISSAGVLESNNIDSISGSINIGGTSATSINLQKNTSIASNQSFTANGWAKFQDATNSATAFQIQNSSSTALLTADTSGMTITIGGALSVTSNVTVGGLLNLSASGIHFNDGTTQTTAAKSASYVSSLPGSPTDGQEVYYIADATNQVVWHLRYNASKTNWEYLGGSPMTVYVSTAESTSTSSGSSGYVDLTTVGPAITLPLAGTYRATFGAQASSSGRSGGSGSSITNYMKLNIGGTLSGPDATADTQLYSGTGTMNITEQIVQSYQFTAASASTNVDAQYQISAPYGSGSYSGTFANRYLTITPVTVH